MKRIASVGLGIAVLGAGLGIAASGAEPAKVAYPQGYRSWTHVKSMLIEAGHPLADPFAGLHHVYANAQALDGLRTGKYADGAILVFDLLSASAGQNAVTEGKRKFVGVMERDVSRYRDTGGWGYEAFAGDSRTERLVADGGAGCHACHSERANAGYVFSTWRD
jgi:hypothetical protein